MTPDELLAAAKDLMQRPDTQINGIWPRAAALLARQVGAYCFRNRIFAPQTPLKMTPRRTLLWMAQRRTSP